MQAGVWPGRCITSTSSEPSAKRSPSRNRRSKSPPSGFTSRLEDRAEDALHLLDVLADADRRAGPALM
jgi:hypothetical protein